MIEKSLLIGGFHFSTLAIDENLGGYAKLLDQYKTRYYTCHCTGEKQYQFMKKMMEKLSYISVGDVVEIPKKDL